MTPHMQISERDAKRYKKYLKQLTADVAKCIDNLDYTMGKPPAVERDKAIARITNALEMANDKAWHFGLGESLNKKRYKGQVRHND